MPTALPPFLMTSEQGSFARKTIEERKPLIIDQILSDYDYTPSIRKALLEFKEELAHGKLKPLVEQTSDRKIWDEDIQPWLGKSWLEIPWYLAETYFYRRVLEIVQYFQPGPWMERDPYGRLKDNEIRGSLPVFIETYQAPSSNPGLENFSTACYNALWGNRGDLSNLDVFETDMGAQHDRIILNQVEEAYSFIKTKTTKVAYVFDNVGKELYFDLALIDHLIKSGLADSVTCYLKNQPFFVSDVMPKDLLTSIDHLSASGSKEAEALASRLLVSIKSKKVVLESPPFFTTGRMYREMPEILKSQIGGHDLTILKGDVNYRRLFGDRHWPPTTPVSQAAGYFPTSFFSLRTLKGEIILGVTSELIHRLESEAEDNWLINGKHGMLTFYQKTAAS
jgi:hypothetical protein